MRRAFAPSFFIHFPRLLHSLSLDTYVRHTVAFSNPAGPTFTHEETKQSNPPTPANKQNLPSSGQTRAVAVFLVTALIALFSRPLPGPSPPPLRPRLSSVVSRMLYPASKYTLPAADAHCSSFTQWTVASPSFPPNQGPILLSSYTPQLPPLPTTHANRGQRPISYYPPTAL
jgi:hypothetical protein